MHRKTGKNCIIYCRVSSNKQAQEGESLEVQEMICRTISKTKGFGAVVPNDVVWAEPFTGSTINRPVFDEMMRFIKQNHQKIDAVIFRDIDRLTRGGAGDYQQIKNEFEKYDIELIDSTGIIQPKVNTIEHTGFEYPWSKVSPSSMAETIKAEAAKSDRTNILSRLIGAEIPLVQAGYQIGVPNDGFLNKRIFVNGKKRTIMVPDPMRAKYYIEMFNLRASGKYSDAEIVETISAMGFKTREQNLWNKMHTKIIGKRGGRQLSVKQLQRIIQKPIYCGIICEKWTHYKPVRAQFGGLVSVSIFNKANAGKVFVKEERGTLELLRDYKVVQKRNKNNPLFPYRTFVLCPICNKPFKGSASTGKGGKRRPAYHCSRGHKRFAQKKKVFDGVFEGFIRGLEYDENAIKALKIALGDVYKARGEQIAKYAENVENNIVSLKQRQQEALEAFKKAASPVLQKKFEEEIESLEIEIEAAQQRKPTEELSEYDIKNFIKCVEYLMEHHEELLLNKENQELQRRLLPLVFDEFPTYDEIASGTPKVSFIFAKTKELAFASSQSVDLIRNSWNQLISELKEWQILWEEDLVLPLKA